MRLLRLIKRVLVYLSHSSADIVYNVSDSQFPNNLSSFATSAVKTHSEGPIERTSMHNIAHPVKETTGLEVDHSPSRFTHRKGGIKYEDGDNSASSTRS
jgi:hypothetical protein